MVYSAYSQVAFLTLLAFSVINSEKSEEITSLTRWLEGNEVKIKEVISELKAAEGRAQNITAKILSQNASLRGEIENYTDCLETAYKNKWGQILFETRTIFYVDRKITHEIINCYEHQAWEYYRRTQRFTVDKCQKNLPSSNQEDLQELKEQIEAVFYNNKEFSAKILDKNIYTTYLKTLTGN
ncbi:unnamed protein product [Trichobilharzia szidati]|nr:unnamed protein product [Trichobilharzia szidati]